MERQLIALIEHLFIFTDDMTRGHCGYVARARPPGLESRGHGGRRMDGDGSRPSCVNEQRLFNLTACVPFTGAVLGSRPKYLRALASPFPSLLRLRSRSP